MPAVPAWNRSRMSPGELRTICLLFLLLLASAHLLGWLCVRLRQPRVIGEILAGVLIGPAVLGRLAPGAESGLASTLTAPSLRAVLDFIYQLGLLLLMFLSGTETRRLFARQDRRATVWLVAFGTGLPFLLFVAFGGYLPMEPLLGPAQQRTSLLLVCAIAVAVTSIPVISKIFHDLGILHTRFASVVLGVAVIEDVVLWGVLAVATALAASGALPAGQISQHVAVTIAFFAFGMTLASALLRRINRARWNVWSAASPVGYVVTVLFTYVVAAAALDVSLVFAAFLAGFALSSDSRQFVEALDSISKFSFAVFIPVYFALVGYRLDLGHTFSLTMLAIALAIGCALKIAAVLAGATLAGFGRLDSLNLAIASNARGGPGIVLASVAADAGIISAAFYTTLVLVAVITSQMAGAWLDFVLRRGWPLISPAEAVATGDAAAAAERAA